MTVQCRYQSPLGVFVPEHSEIVDFFSCEPIQISVSIEIQPFEAIELSAVLVTSTLLH